GGATSFNEAVELGAGREQPGVVAGFFARRNFAVEQQVGQETRVGVVLVANLGPQVASAGFEPILVTGRVGRRLDLHIDSDVLQLRLYYLWHWAVDLRSGKADDHDQAELPAGL